MSAARNSIPMLALVVGALLFPAETARAQHRGGGHAGHFGGGRSISIGRPGAGVGHYRPGIHRVGQYGRGHFGGYYRGYYPRFCFYGSLFGYYGRPYYYRYPGYAVGYPYAWYGDYGYRIGPYEYADDEAPVGEPRESGATLRLNVRPDDAVVYVDGEFRGPARRVTTLTLTPGRHSIEVLRPGYESFERAIEIGRDRPADIDVELRAGGR